ncbi:hypothetical protein TCAL_08732 [Tigriopus californicus]|uniref:Apple domain-containing protein n=1 Tax=Tigriopus californicus TaxID=6832 RepID=A0A553P5M4_TIGCA|nr:uncharacterized protein LOC131877465 [Tigriopus californicus]TRY72987.1 hypothetical protein TCAL_08732 [Tigriopus californicus]|eukprot:TCALIF_08732-PA protein Name:"Protein of unknown function" AED:0.00 eAED:0.00 QI:49/1/1/1/1/1/2/137/469
MLDRTLFQLVLIVSLCHLSWADQTFCHVSGRCQHVFFVRMGVEDYNACLAECKREPTCRTMSFLGGSTELNCELYQETDLGELEKCDGCFSGQFRCHFDDGGDSPDDIQRGCRVDGVCEGTKLSDETGVDNLDDCNKACADNAQCQWSSFDMENLECTLWEKCSTINASDRTFSSHVQCAPDRFDSMVLYLNEGASNEILLPLEMCDSCSVVAPAILDQDSFLTWANGQLLTCRGNQSCHVFNMFNQTWDNLEVEVPPNVGICPGKISSNELFTLETFSDKTYILDLNTFEFVEHISRPDEGIDNPCLVKLNDTHFMAIGGASRVDGTFSTATFIFNVQGQEWTEGEPLRVPLSDHACPLFTKSDGSSYVIAFGGAQRHSYIYDPEGKFWRSGPNLPRDGTFKAHRLGEVILAEAVEDENHSFYELSPDDERWIALTSHHNFYDGTESLAIPEFLFNCPISCPSHRGEP